MALPEWLQRIVHSVESEYNRRILRASAISAYGEGHGHAGHDPHASEPEAAVEEFDAEEAEIVNVPPGTRIHGH